jgi:plasmid stabilization system protein ParE
MAFRIRYHEDALIDLEAIFDRSREKHPETTEQFASGLFNYLDLLQASPYIGTKVRGQPEIRQLLYSPLYVYYRVDEDRRAIEILHFWHAARRPPRL